MGLPVNPHARALERKLLAGQGLFYLATGAWPLIDRTSFERVTGPKADFWLVKTVGALVAVIGASLLVAARGRGGESPRTLSAGAALALAAVDINYVARRRISPVYLLDAGVELALAAGWLAAARPRRPPAPEILMGETTVEEDWQI
jgi:hypothetical protein